MKNNILKYLLSVFLLFISSCAPQMNAVWQKDGFNSRSFKKVAIITISNNLDLRQNLESSIVDQLQKNHPETVFVTGMKLLPPNVEEDKWTKENIVSLLKQHNIDAVLTTALINSYTSNEYVSGEQYFIPNYYIAGRYIYSTYSAIYTSGYYEQSQKYVLESSLFDLIEGNETEKSLVWKGQSEVSDPLSIASGAKSYSKNLVKYIEKHQIIKSQ